MSSWKGPANMGVWRGEDVSEIVNKSISNMLRLVMDDVIFIFNGDDSIPFPPFKNRTVKKFSISISIFCPAFFWLAVYKIA